MNYMGIDHHKQYSHITLMDEKGKKLKSGRVANYCSEVERLLDGTGEAKAVIEAGCSSYTMVDVMDELLSGPVVKTKSDLFLRCISFNMLQPFASDDKPQEAYRIPLKIGATSLDYVWSRTQSVR